MRGMKAGYFSRFDTSPVTGGKDKIVMGLYMVKITLVFDFATRGVGDEDRKGVGSGIYEGSFVIGDARNPEVGEPIVRVLLAVGINELRCDARD
jgi:hypothetical protein